MLARVGLKFYIFLCTLMMMIMSVVGDEVFMRRDLVMALMPAGMGLKFCVS